MSNKVQVKVGNYENLEDFCNVDTMDCILPVKVKHLVSAYKGSSEMPEDKRNKMAKGFSERGYIKIREQERLLFSTGMYLEIPKGVKGHINTHPNISIFKGLRVVGPELIVSGNGELQVLVHNDSLHLSQIDMDEVLAMVTFSPVMNLDFSIKEP
jgi:dUTPase